jgi:hypothetical protein
MNNSQQSRRRFLALGGSALTVLPILAVSGNATAATNAALRTSLKYQAKPEGDKQCSNCMQFVPGKTPKDLGGCKIMAGDTEIAPNAYCAAWVKKA